MKFKSIVAFALISFASHAGNETGNGGDYLASQFYDTAVSVLQVAKNIAARNGSPETLEGIDLVRLQDTIDAMHVTSTDAVLYGPDHKPRDAINDVNAKTILFNSDNWIDHSDRPAEQVATVMHEVCTLAGMESSDNYITSRKLLNALRGARWEVGDFRPSDNFYASFFHKDILGLYSCVYQGTRIAAAHLLISSDSMARIYYPDPDWKVLANWYAESKFEFINKNLSCRYKYSNDAAGGVFKMRLIGKDKLRVTHQGCAAEKEGSSYNTYLQNRFVTLVCTKR